MDNLLGNVVEEKENGQDALNSTCLWCSNFDIHPASTILFLTPAHTPIISIQLIRDSVPISVPPLVYYHKEKEVMIWILKDKKKGLWHLWQNSFPTRFRSFSHLWEIVEQVLLYAKEKFGKQVAPSADSKSIGRNPSAVTSLFDNSRDSTELSNRAYEGDSRNKAHDSRKDVSGDPQ